MLFSSLDISLMAAIVCLVRMDLISLSDSFSFSLFLMQSLNPSSAISS